MSYKRYQYSAALPEHPEALVMVLVMRARTWRGWRYMWGDAQKHPAVVRAAPGCVQVKPGIVGPRELIMVTHWKDEASLMAFFKSPAHLEWVRHVAAHPEDLNLTAEIFKPHTAGLYLHEPQGLALAYPRA
jgi:hypothetical protein